MSWEALFQSCHASELPWFCLISQVGVKRVIFVLPPTLYCMLSFHGSVRCNTSIRARETGQGLVIAMGRRSRALHSSETVFNPMGSLF